MLTLGLYLGPYHSAAYLLLFSPSPDFPYNPTALAISGPGWFSVHDPGHAATYATRYGKFHIDQYGYIVTENGLRLQGLTRFAPPTVGDLRIDNSNATNSTAPIMNYTIDFDGTIRATLADYTPVVCGHILLQNLQSTQQLTRVAYHYYLITPADGSQPSIVPGTSGTGLLLADALDMTPEPVVLNLEPDAAQAGPLARGVLTATGIPTDLGIAGPGLFLVRNPATSELFATRAGLFLVDGDGYLITYDRLRVQGYTDPDLAIRGDVRIDNTGAPMESAAALQSFEIQTDGKTIVRLADGMEFIRSQVLLWTFDQPASLTATNRARYIIGANASPEVIDNPGGIFEDGIRSGNLELINVTPDLLAIRQTLNLPVQGSIVNTGVATDLAMSGRGYFSLRDPASGNLFATRCGTFHLDANNYFVTSGGLRVQGFSNSSLTLRGDVRIDGSGRPVGADPNAPLESFAINPDGTIDERLTDGTDFIGGLVLLQNFGEPFLLIPDQNHIYTNAAAALPQPLAPAGTAGLGIIVSGALEIPTDEQTFTLPARAGFRLRITGEPGHTWTLQATTNFTCWENLTITTNNPDEIEYTDAQSTNHPARYYRIAISE